TRPEFSDLRLDWGAIRRAAGLARLFRRGDNGLLAGLAAIFEREGVRVVGAHQIAPRLIVALSAFDAGQGAVVAAGRVLAIEAAEGTDAMLARVAEMRANGRLRFAGPAGVLIKAPKQGQDLRFDMPAIGAKTIEGAANARLRGVAVAAGHALILERERCAREADAAGLFVAGFPAG